MTTAMIIMVAVMAFSAIGLMFVAIVEFVMYLRQSRTQAQPVVTVPFYQPVPEMPKKEEEKTEVVIEQETKEIVEEPVCDDTVTNDENSVTFGITETQRMTIKDAYELMDNEGKNYFDRIMDAARDLEMARIIEATYAVTIMQGRDNIGKLKISRGAVVLDCTVINPELAKYNKENGKKIKSRPTRFRIESQEELDAAVYTLGIANQTSLENRNLKRKNENKEEIEV